MPPLQRLRKNQPQRPLAVLRLAKEVIGQRGRRQLRHRVAIRDVDGELPQWRVANLEIDLGVERDLVEAKLVHQQLRHGQLWQDVVGLHLQLVVAGRVAVHERLNFRVVRRRSDRTGSGEPVGRELRQAVHAHRLELHGPVVDQPQMPAVPHWVDRHEPQRLEPHRERAQRSLCPHHEIVVGGLLAVELHHEPPSVLLFLDAPVQDVPPVDADHLAVADQVQLESAHPPLHHAVIEMVNLPGQPRADGDVHRRLRRVEQLRDHHRLGFLPANR